jgi:adenosylcobinamide-GDP ribazoletransferase
LTAIDLCAKRKIMRAVLSAFKFLTRRGRINQLSARQISAAIPYFPLVGVFFGAVLAFLNRLLDPYLESEILATLLVAILALLTGACHFDGLRSTFDASRGTEIPAQQRANGGFGVLAIVLVVLLKVQALIVSGEMRGVCLLLAPMFASWSVVVFLFGSSFMAEGSPRIVAANVRAWHLVLTTAFGLSFAAFFIGRTALWIGLCLSLFALLGRSYLRWRNGYINDDAIGAMIELSETLSFVLLASW